MPRLPDPSDVLLAVPPLLPAGDQPCLLPIDKPGGMTSFSVVRRVRRLSGVRKVGHAGTLDPMATGLLIVMIGPATRLMNSLLSQDKSYEATIRLGERTASFDAETPVVEVRDATSITRDKIEAAASEFVGTIEQETPIFSAVKVGGERLYRKARRGDSVVLPKRVVEISSFEIRAIRGSDVDIALTCSSGTYVRSLANDLGLVLGVGGHLTRLRRTRIGNHDVDDAWDLNRLESAMSAVAENGG